MSARRRDAILALLPGLLLMALLAASSGCTARSTGSAPTVTVFAAANLREALGQLAREFRAAGGDSVVLVFGSTGDLATQLANGAPGDLFLAANESEIDSLAARDLVAEGSRTVYAVGRLALLTRCARGGGTGRADGLRSARDGARCMPLALDDLARDSIRIVAVADPRHAPYGRAARQALERTGLWTSVQPKLVMGSNVSQAEQFVSTGNADAGFVSLSLVAGVPGRVFVIVDSALHEPLAQAGAVMRRAANPAGAAAFLAHLRTASGVAVLERYGFTVPAAGVPREPDR